MRHSNSTRNASKNTVVLGLSLLCASVACFGAPAARAATHPGMLDQFSATTASMTPSGVVLRIDVREWSDEATRAAVVDALGRDSDVQKTLASLPTMGYVWLSGGGVGYSVKYAHRASTAQGERVTLVTDRLLGAYDRKPWAAGAPASPHEFGYSVIELYLDGNGHGDGTLSLAADVKLDAAQGLVTLAADAGAPRVLANAKLEPKPYSVGGK